MLGLHRVYQWIGWLVFSTIMTTKKQIEFCRVVLFYWLPIGFLKIDLFYLKRFLVIPAHILSQRFLRQSGLDKSYTYGATPLTSLDRILSHCNLKSGQTVADLGCGPGRSCYFIHKRFNVKAVGVDVVPSFIQTANEIKAHFSIADVEFKCMDILEVDCRHFDCVYMFGTTWHQSFMVKLIRKLESEMKEGATVVTVKQPLSRYFPETEFVVEQCIPVAFFWGKDPAFIHRLKT